MRALDLHKLTLLETVSTQAGQTDTWYCARCRCGWDTSWYRSRGIVETTWRAHRRMMLEDADAAPSQVEAI